MTPEGCWQWIGSVNPKTGYGTYCDSRKKRPEKRHFLAHRWSWEYVNGPMSRELVSNHYLFPDSCIGRACANPDHIRPVTPRENLLRGDTTAAAHRAKTHCKYGHPFDETNTFYENSFRQCRTCKNARGRQWKRDHGGKGLVPTKDRTECVHGHRYTDATTYVDKHGKRSCVTCRRNASARARARRRLTGQTRAPS